MKKKILQNEKDLDNLPSVWVARDDDGSLYVYDSKPIKAYGIFHCGAGGDSMLIGNKGCYPEITFENSPVKIKLLFIET